MNGRHHDDFPGEWAGDGGHDAASLPPYGHGGRPSPGGRPGPGGSGGEASGDWFNQQPAQGDPYGAPPQGQPGGPYQGGSNQPGPGQGGGPGRGGSGGPYQNGPGAQARGGSGQGGGNPETPEWFTPRQPDPGQSPYGSGGFTGASDPGGHGLGRPAGGGGGPAYPPPGEGRSANPAPGGFGAYDSISRSDGGPTRGGGSGGSGGYGGGRSGEYGRRKNKRSVSALIGPMAGAVGLALLLGVGVYAFAASGGGCSGSNAISLNVSAAPEIAPAVTKAVSRFNGDKAKVDGKCVKAQVKSAESAAVTTLLSGQGVTGGATQRPDVWVPDSSLWASLIRTSDKGKRAIQVTKTSLAQSPIVVAMPATLAARLKNQGVIAQPSWDNLLRAAGGTAGGAVSKNQMIPPGLVKLMIPDPTRTAAGMGSLVLTNILLTNDPNKEAIFTGMVRTVSESTAPSVKAEFASFKKDRQGRYPIALAPEQSVWSHNKGNPPEAAVAVYPIEGTISMDYPFTVTSEDGTKAKAARLLEQAMNTDATRSDVRSLGFRSADGKAPSSFGAKTGVSPQRPRPLPAPQPGDVTKIMQAWSKLSLNIRMLTLIDISGSMEAKVAPGVNRLQATARVAQGGLSLMPDNTELGVWLFSTKLDGNLDYHEEVSIGPLGERAGSATRRQLILSGLGAMRPKRNGDTGLYDSMLAAFKYMKKTYKPEFGNSILLLTDGKNDDKDGPTLQATLKALRKEYDATKPVQVIMIGFGQGVDVNELNQIATATRGSVHVANTPQEIQKIFLQALSRRVCSPSC